VGPEHLVDGPTVFLDVSVPGDAMPGLESDRPSLLYIRGGVVQLPHGDEAESVLELPGWHLPDGHAYACLAETLLLGLEGIDENFSCGEVSAESVFRILQLADKHGFVLGDYQKRASI
jgi:predicted amino acid dehydrogenase